MINKNYAMNYFQKVKIVVAHILENAKNVTIEFYRGNYILFVPTK